MTGPADKGFKDPNVTLSRIYTRTGDKGDTGLTGGSRVAKDDIRIEAYGTVDELNAFIGLARGAVLDVSKDDSFARALLRVQHQLFNLGSMLSTPPGKLADKQPQVVPGDVDWLEQTMDAATARLPPLRSFVLPGGSRVNGLLHIARTVCRRAERRCVTLRRAGGCGELEVRYLNRLSDALFVWSRQAAAQQGVAETLWDPNQA
ncbi:MAG: cob(I)yrinic acid a,c-diamide adenosyltransferase [Candidatus Thermoplasmatota archaeon]